MGRLAVEVVDVLGEQVVDTFLDVIVHGRRRQTFSHEPLLKAQFVVDASFNEKRTEG